LATITSIGWRDGFKWLSREMCNTGSSFTAFDLRVGNIKE
jgi:hypothetical protein